MGRRWKEGFKFKITLSALTKPILVKFEKRLAKLVKSYRPKETWGADYGMNQIRYGDYFRKENRTHIGWIIDNAGWRWYPGTKAKIEKVRKEIEDIFLNDDYFQDIEYTFTNVERVYATRYDGKLERLAAA